MNIFSKKKRKTSKPIAAALAIMVLASAFWAATKASAVMQLQSEQPIVLYSNQVRDDLRATLLQGINAAERSITLIIYGLTDSAVIQALRQKSEQGVEVTVICDPEASAYAPKKLGSLVKVKKRYHKGLMHQKILTVDGVKTWIGSANMTGESLSLHGNLVMGIYSAEVATAVHTKAKQMLGSSKEPVVHSNHSIAGQEIELWFLPDDINAIDAIKDLIVSAQKTIKVAMFTWTRQDLAKEIIAAHQRGVDVRVVVDYSSAKGASAKVVKLMKTQGVPVFLSNGNGLLHHKFIYVDDQTLAHGSANWTLAAFTKNDDCFMILHKLTEQQKQQMGRLWNVISNECVPP